MVSMNTNLSVLSGIKEQSLYARGHAANKNTGLKYSAKSEIFQFSFQIKTDTRQQLSNQNAIINFSQLTKEDKANLFYLDTPISELSSDQASSLVKDDGYFGIDKTSQRIIDFVLKGAGDDLDRLKAGREGVLRGFAEAEKAWGGQLPEISYKTIEKGMKALDNRIAELGGKNTGIIV